MNLDETAVRGPGLRYIANLDALRELSIEGLGLHDQDILALESLRLKELRLSGNSLSGESLQILATMSSLHTLELSYMPIENDDVAVLAALPNLKKLAIADTNVTEEYVETVLPHVRVLM